MRLRAWQISKTSSGLAELDQAKLQLGLVCTNMINKKYMAKSLISFCSLSIDQLGILLAWVGWGGFTVIIGLISVLVGLKLDL